MKLIFITIFILCITQFISCSDKETNDALTTEDSSLKTKIELAKCLTQKGWIMYGSYTCSACLAQKKLFGEAFEHIKEIECNPHAPNTEVEQCIEKKIRTTPTWILEKEGQEIISIPEYQLLEDLAMHSDCEFQNQ